MKHRAKPSNIAMAVRVALLLSCPWLAAHAGPPLPVACPGGPCGAGVPFASYGAASYAISGSKGTVNQTSTNAILNWQSFDIAAGHTVQFVQPGTSSVALNEIYDSNPTQIFGALNANGHVFLINQNGIVFGNGATVNVGGLVASTLPITAAAAVATGDSQTYYGLIIPGQTGLPAFQAATDANGNVLSKGITVEQGATLESADGGQIYLFAPTVSNLGTIETPDGQTILAGGTSVYLAESGDPNLRGLVVEVGGTGAANSTVSNGPASNSSVTSAQQLVGQILAKDGNITLAALAVNQYGLVNATTSVNENGSIYLEARNGTLSSEGADAPGQGGALVLGQNSDTEVTLDSSDPTGTVDSVTQPPSTIEMSGAKIDMLQGSVARATGGVIDVYAAQDLGTLTSGKGLELGDASDGSRFYMAPGSVLDVSGASTTLPVSDNVISAQLLATELADSPLQRGGPLQGQTINFDIDAHGTNADGSTWWGTPLADVEGEILDMDRNVIERNLDGGTVNIESQGDVILAPTSTINVSGGYIQYTGGYIDTSELLTVWGQDVPVASASPDIPYAGIVTASTTTDAKWGVTQTYQTAPSSYAPGYLQGYDAGTLELSAPAFIMDGTVKASTVVGPYQIQPTTAEPTTAAQWATSFWIEGSMYRPYDEVPAGATLLIGSPENENPNDFTVANVAITPGEVLSGLQSADGGAFDPLTDPLPASLTTSTLQPSLLEQFQNVEIYTNGKLTESPGVSLSLAPGGNLSVRAASIDIEGGVDIPSGTVSLTAEPTYAEQGQSNITTTLTLGPDASIMATGEWINDSTALYPDGNTAPLYINGGSVSLTAASPADATAATSLQLDPGSVIDVSGGAQLTSSGTLNAGSGGGITIDASTALPTSGGTYVMLTGSPMPPTSLRLGATLEGYGLYDGGSLSISAAGICIAAGNCSGADPDTMLWLAPGFFNSGGFASYSITADQNGLTLAPGLSLALVESNLELSSGYVMRPDATSLAGLTTVGILPLQTRQPVDLSLALYYPANETVPTATGTAYQELSPSSALPSLVVPRGDVISTDPLGSISLASDTELDVEGALRAPGGTISLILALPPGGGTTLGAYDPAQAIWLGADAVLDASGADQIFPNSFGEPTGSVLPGGTVSLNASIGSLELLPGSQVDVAGTSGTIDIVPVGGGRGEDERIASAGGTIDLTSADGAVIDGTLLAAAGSAGGGANQPAGGSLYVTANAEENAGVGPSTNEILVSSTLAPTIVAPGSPAPEAQQGLTLLPADSLAQAGFSILSLSAQNSATGTGEIAFTDGATLTAGEEVSLDAPTYAVEAGTTGSVDAPYIEFGSSYNYVGGAAPASDATGGPGVLDVSGNFIELYGTSSLLGIGTANFDSAGDLRVLGIQYGSQVDNPSGAISGALYADGTINLTAEQIYPSTLTQFVISADPATVADLAQLTTGAITIHGSEGADTDLLSAGGSLTLSAASITQDGVLRAPFGTIALDATSLTLGPGSLTSTSADGLTVPFGTTQGNTGGGAETSYDWVYPLLESIYAVYGTDGLPPPSQHIELNAADIDVQSGAVIDLSGGGDLQAYEWVPGPGGTEDVLDCSDCYAIIPSLKANVAPYDPAIAQSSGTNPQAGSAAVAASSGTNLQVGEAVYLSAGSGVPAGTYILLPARYALLPGAYLVTPMTGTAYQDMQPGQSFGAPDGGTIVSGYLTEMGLPYDSSRLDGFEVTPSSVFLNQAQYNLTTGNSFFSAQIAAATASAADEAASAMRLPQDAGVLGIDAGTFLTLEGSLQASAASGARGAEVDISNPDIVVAASASGVSPSGALVLTTSSLDQLGAQTLLLGGENDDGTIDTTAQSVTILGGASLTAPQVLLTAENQISVDSGASITAAGTAPSAATLSLQGSGAFLGVSAGPQVTLSTATPGSGTLDLASGSSLSARNGSIYLYATGGISTGGSIAAAGGDLAVQAPQISLGSAPSTSGTAVLGSNVLQSGDLASLLLTSSAPIAVYSGGSVSAQNVTIDSPGLVSGLASGESATISATGTTSTPGTLTLNNSQGQSVSSSGSQSGSLTLSASSITLQSAAPTTPGAATPTFGMEGFGSVALVAQNTFSAANDVDFSTDGVLSITSSQITTGAGVTASIEAGYQPTATGAPFIYQPVTLLSPASPASAQTPTALGGSLSITGSSIDLDTRIDMPSGSVALTAGGGSSGDGHLNVDAGGSINVAGVDQTYDATQVATPGGSVALSATGNITLASGSKINVSAGQGGIGGSLSISALNGWVDTEGTLAGTGAAQGGSFSVDAQSFSSDSAPDAGFGALSAAVEAGGFTGSQSYWLQGSPGAVLAVASGTTLKADTVLIEADQGSIDIPGEIDASSTSASGGGSVTLAAGNGIDLEASGKIYAYDTTPGASGGTVELDLGDGNPNATLALSPGSVINVSGGGVSTTSAGADTDTTVTSSGSNGSVLLRVPYQTLANVTLAKGTITGASSTVVEAYDPVSAVSETDSSGDIDITGSEFANWQQDAQNIATSDLPAVEQLSSASGLNVTLEPGIEIDATGNITLDTPWDLSTWRFQDANGVDDVPGVLTLRAGGNVTFDDSLSDGFTSPTSGTLLTPGSGSWSYRIVAGADLNAANPLAITANAAQPAADVTIGSLGSPATVRTGTGFIDVAASGDFVLGDPDSVLYTAGEATADGSPPAPTCGGSACRSATDLPAYSGDGGNIDIDVAGNVEGSASIDQFVNDWSWRQGGETGLNEEAPFAWSIEFSDFDQGVGALGGGNVTIRAGKDIDDFSASIASIGVAQADGSVDVKDGGALTVAAGGSILGGSYYVGAGNITLTAGGSVGPDAAAGTSAPLIGLGESSVSVTARGNVQVADVVNPTLLNSGATEGFIDQNYFSTYGSGSSVSLTSVGGDVVLDDEEGTFQDQYQSSFADDQMSTAQATYNDSSAEPATLDALPPVLSVYAPSGDIDVSRDITLFPSAQGGLQLLASGNVDLLKTQSDVQLVVPDVDPSSLPSIADPGNPNSADSQSLVMLADVAQALNPAFPGEHASTPLFSSVSAYDENPVQVVALNGDITFSATDGSVGLWSGKPVVMSAGGDIIDPNIVAQNLSSGDVTSITAGGDITYPQSRTPTGGIIQNFNQIQVAGPGEVQVTAGGNVNLGTSGGITTVGNLYNPVLPSSGASVSVEAGVGASAATTAQYNAFIQRYIEGSSQFDGQLVSYVEQITGQTGLASSDAKQEFAGMTSEQQRTFVEQLFFYLLQTYGSEAAKSGDNADFADAYAAIQTLFPGDNGTQSTSNAFLANGGDISLYFSQIYTDDGGNISLLAPGGEVDAGLAVAPTAYDLDKSPQQLGIVAERSGNVGSFSYGNFEVNESRVFSADGGDILVWSTQGNIDAGRGSKTSQSAAAPSVIYDSNNGFATVNYYPPNTGSGIQALADTPGVSPGSVYLFAPHGVVNANEGGIVAGNLTVFATQVLGTNNITVTGVEVGVPVAVTGTGAAVVGASAAAGGAVSTAQSSLAQASPQQQQAPKAAAELRWLDVFVLGFGEQTCSASDTECLKRQKHHSP